MKNDRVLLSRIESLREPRHLFVLPDWAEPAAVDSLIKSGYLTCQHHQRDAKGALAVAMNLQVTPKGYRLIHPEEVWSRLAFRGSMAGASLAAMSIVILYLG